MSEGSQVSKVTLCVQILKWQSLTHSLTMTNVFFQSVFVKTVFSKCTQLTHVLRIAS